jgi:t-SNARE complex subunit (syntaxin)
MKLLPLAVLLAVSIPTVIHADEEEGTGSAIKYAAGYAADVTRDAAGNVINDLQDAGHAVAVPTKQAAKSAWGFLSDIGNGIEKSRAISNGDGVTINTSVYSLALRQAERDNTALKTLQKERDERQYNLKRAQKETERLGKLAEDYKDDAVKFSSNMMAALTGIAENTKKLEGWDKAHQEKMDKFLEEHKKLGTLTAQDGNSRVGSHLLASMSETWADLEDAIKKSPDSAAKLGLTARLKSMSSLLDGASNRITEKEAQMMAVTAKINEYAKIDEKQVANDEESMKRQMILGTLNNSVNNLITSADFSKVRAQMAFAHFGDIEKGMAEKGVKGGDVKEAYKKNSSALASQYNNTPFGVYVNGQIAKAMGSVCDIVANQCKDGTNAALFDFLDDSTRNNLKSIEIKGDDKKSNEAVTK